MSQHQTQARSMASNFTARPPATQTLAARFESTPAAAAASSLTASSSSSSSQQQQANRGSHNSISSEDCQAYLAISSSKSTSPAFSMSSSSSGQSSSNELFSLNSTSNLHHLPNHRGGITDYLAQLLRDKETLASMTQLFPMTLILHHAHRLIDDEIDRVRSKLLEPYSDGSRLELPEPIGDKVTITKKVFFPKNQYPDFNFTGRILGPRGATIKRLEKEIGEGCTLAIRGKGSDPKNEARNPGLIKEEQHVLVTIKDTPNRASLLLEFALKKIQPFLSPVDEEKDELKKSQMIELALLKGNYREGAAMQQQQLAEQMQRMMISPSYATSSYYKLPASMFSASAAGALGTSAAAHLSTYASSMAAPFTSTTPTTYANIAAGLTPLGSSR